MTSTGLLGQIQQWWHGLRQEDSRSAVNSTSAPDRPPVPVFATSFPLEAEVVRGFLECHDIPALIQKEAVSQAYPFTVGELAAIQVLVPAALAESALALLAEQRAVSQGEVGEAAATDGTRPVLPAETADDQ